jgi:hypothetical protein
VPTPKQRFGSLGRVLLALRKSAVHRSAHNRYGPGKSPWAALALSSSALLRSRRMARTDHALVRFEFILTPFVHGSGPLPPFCRARNNFVAFRNATAIAVRFMAKLIELPCLHFRDKHLRSTRKSAPLMLGIRIARRNRRSPARAGATMPSRSGCITLLRSTIPRSFGRGAQSGAE